jgi:hypothetical protein
MFYKNISIIRSCCTKNTYLYKQIMSKAARQSYRDKKNNCHYCNNNGKISRQSYSAGQLCPDCHNREKVCELCNGSYKVFTKTDYYTKSWYNPTRHVGYTCPKDQIECPTCYETIDRADINTHCMDDTVVTIKTLSRILESLTEKDDKISELKNTVEYLVTEISNLKYRLEKLESEKETHDSEGD